jgi:homocysteine S-methyltransferase
LLDTNPDAIKQVHMDYYEAGSNISTTATYQASMDGFIQAGYSVEDATLFCFQRSIELAHSARLAVCHTGGDSIQRFIAFSLGCYGAYLANG